MTRTVAPLGGTAGTTSLVTLTNARGVEVQFMGRGGIVLSTLVPDRDGVLADVALGFQNLESYIDDRFYFGTLIGRNANRIANGAFTLDGTQYALTRNDGPNHLHGGTRGFSAYEWNVELFQHDDEVGAVLSIVSPDGDQGYPGEVRATVTYTLTDANEFVVRYRATVNAPTPLDLTQHSYFNLSGGAQRDVLNHELTINASYITPVDRTQIPTGQLRHVAGTPFDFRTPHRIGDRISSPDEQLRLGGGYDHNYVLDGGEGISSAGQSRTPRLAATLHDPHSGRVLEVLTTEPAMQVFTGNELHEVVGAKGGSYARYAGIALETQHFPNTPNEPSFPASVIRQGQQYASETVYRFSVDA